MFSSESLLFPFFLMNWFSYLFCFCTYTLNLDTAISNLRFKLSSVQLNLGCFDFGMNMAEAKSPILSNWMFLFTSATSSYSESDTKLSVVECALSASSFQSSYNSRKMAPELASKLHLSLKFTIFNLRISSIVALI